MQFTSAIVLAFAVFGINAIPSPNGGSSSSCSSSGTALCCDSGASLLSLNCVLSSLLGSGCNQQNICCQNFGQGSSQTCYYSDGTEVDIPITIIVL